MDIVIATGNRGKLRELAELLNGCPVSLHSLSDVGAPSPPEDGLSFVENALIKARSAARHAGMPALADDSGLLVDALEGAPGLYSARFASAPASGQSQDAANNALLLERLADQPEGCRHAHFHCTCVYLRHAEDPQPLIAMADWHGQITRAERGSGGFGYDPLFVADGMAVSSAELEASHKNRISHRGQAVAAMVRLLRNEYGWG